MRLIQHFVVIAATAPPTQAFFSSFFPFYIISGGYIASGGKKNACTPLPKGFGPIPDHDNAHAFLTYPAFSTAASEARTPANYTRSFADIHACTTDANYLGFVHMVTYDTELCAARCTENDDCVGINLFFERDPTIEVGDDCKNPPSTTTIKCTLWGDRVTEKNARNEGYTEKKFAVAIAGSNGYNNRRAGKAQKGTAGRAVDVPHFAAVMLIGLSVLVLLHIS